MHLEKEFDVRQTRDVATVIAGRDETLISLFPEAETEIVARAGNRRTAASHYTALGRSGTATFHFTTLDDGDLEFEKVCDGNVWRELKGRLSFHERGEGTRVRLTLDGRTKPLIPEFTIKGTMSDQIEEMATALRERLEDE